MPLFILPITPIEETGASHEGFNIEDNCVVCGHHVLHTHCMCLGCSHEYGDEDEVTEYNAGASHADFDINDFIESNKDLQTHDIELPF